MNTVYGIPNCDTIKKARKWLSDNAIEYTFYDYKKQGVPEKELKAWVKKLGWESLLNTRGTTWRKLDDETKNSVNEASAIRIMMDNPSIIKRPVLISNGVITVGFKSEIYKKLFQ